MTKFMLFLSFGFLVSCAAHRGPASVNGHPVAYDSMALGNVKASAVKRESKQDVCFDITLVGKNVKKDHTLASNWSFAWVDKNDQYHLLPASQRQPASAPKGGAVVAPYGFHHEYTNSFTACAPKTQYGEVKGLVLTPKDLPYKKSDGMKLSWNE